MHAKTPTYTLPALSAVAAAVLLGACGGSSSSPDTGAANPRLEAQAVDGYLVDSKVFCDDTESGRTGLAGRFDCPLNTDLFTIQGGKDVGFDQESRTGMQFVGKLKSPGSLAFVTPLSTIAVDMSVGADGTFDETKFQASVEQIAQVVGESGLNLNEDPSQVMQLVRLNAKINTFIAEFGDTTDNYATATKVFAEVLATAASNGSSYNLIDDVSVIVEQVNARLVQIDPSLGKSEADRAALVAKVQSANAAINAARSPEGVAEVVTEIEPPAPVLTIDRDEAIVSHSTTMGSGMTDITLGGFESSAQVGASITGGSGSFNAYGTVVTGDTDRLEIGQSAFDVGSSLSAATVSLGFELMATEEGDTRYFSVVTSDAMVTTNADTDSMMLTMEAGSELTVRAVDTDGTATDTTVTLENDYEFASENSGINVSFWDIDEQLEDEGFGDVTEEPGNFRLTAVVGDLRVAQRDQGEVSPASSYTVEAGMSSVSGVGFQGYITLLPPAAP